MSLPHLKRRVLSSVSRWILPEGIVSEKCESGIVENKEIHNFLRCPFQPVTT